MKNFATLAIFAVFSTFSHYIPIVSGDDGPKKCSTSEGIPGLCRPLPDCIPIQKNYVEKITCWEESFFEVVCCPEMSHLSPVRSRKHAMFPSRPHHHADILQVPSRPHHHADVLQVPSRHDYPSGGSDYFTPDYPELSTESVIQKSEGPGASSDSGQRTTYPQTTTEPAGTRTPKPHRCSTTPTTQTPDARGRGRQVNFPTCGIAPKEQIGSGDNFQQVLSRMFQDARKSSNIRQARFQRAFDAPKAPYQDQQDRYRISSRNRRRIPRQAKPPRGVQFIVGGRTSEDNTWPWMAAIYVSNFGRPHRFKCGGTVISKKHILTAAHCFKTSARQREIRGQYSARLGATNITDPDEGFEFEIKKVTLHENFKPPSYYNDIALLEIDDIESIYPAAHPICLPLKQTQVGELEFKIATILGWGSLTFAGRDSKTLNEVDVPVTTISYCKEAYSILNNSKGYPNGITTEMVCAGYRSGGKDACQGDSGGPLMMLNENRQWTLQGIISGGFQCARPGFPGIYTRVSAYTDWILKNI